MSLSSEAIRRFWGVVLCILAVSALPCIGCDQSRRGVSLGEAAPPVELGDLTGGSVVVPEDVKGQVLVIRFWADCCSYNIHEMEGLDALYARYKDRGLAVLTIYSGKEREKAQGFVDELKIPYPVLLDTGSTAAHRYGVSKLPTTFIVDRKGIVREKIIGESEKQSWQESYARVVASLL